MLLDGGEYPLSAGRIHLIPPWVRFTCRCRGTLKHLYAHFDLLGLPGPVVREAFPRPITLPRDRIQEAVARRLGRLVSARTLPKAALMSEGKAVIFRALATVIAGLPPALAERCQSLAGRSGNLAPALQGIEQSMHLPISNSDLARRCRMSEDHFIRSFRILVGQTPAQYVLECRIARAAEQLLFSQDSIDAIALAHGFPDRYYFTRAFTRRIGVPPGAYRRAKRA